MGKRWVKLAQEVAFKGEVLVELGAWAGMALMGVGICYLAYLGLKYLGWVEPLGAGMLLAFVVVGPVGACVLRECIIKYYGSQESSG